MYIHNHSLFFFFFLVLANSPAVTPHLFFATFAAASQNTHLSNLPALTQNIVTEKQWGGGWQHTVFNNQYTSYSIAAVIRIKDVWLIRINWKAWENVNLHITKLTIRWHFPGGLCSCGSFGPLQAGQNAAVLQALCQLCRGRWCSLSSITTNITSTMTSTITFLQRNDLRWASSGVSLPQLPALSFLSPTLLLVTYWDPSSSLWFLSSSPPRPLCLCVRGVGGLHHCIYTNTSVQRYKSLDFVVHFDQQSEEHIVSVWGFDKLL